MSNDPLRKHHKTCSGCWTCRARKVKCDEGRPTCRQCRRNGRECEGYNVRLRWVINGDGDSDLSYQLAQSQRSRVALSPHRTSIPFSGVDEILTTLDALDSHRKQADRTDVSLFISGFGVFGADVESPWAEAERSTADTNSSIDSRSGQPESNGRIIPYPAYSTDLLLWNSSPCSLGDEQGRVPPGSAPGLFRDTTISPHENPQSPLDVTRNEHENILQLLHAHDDVLSVPSPNLCPEPLYLSPTERFLINHYANRVVQLFCVVDNEKSLWKTIHLPKALQAAGELSLTGSTSTIRKALLSTLLSISAFCLFNYRKSQLRRDEAIEWKATAEEFRCKAIELLKDAMETDLYSRPLPKYKDFLATMLSMVTINVISGDIDTCGLHLDGALRFIHHAQSWKTRYSSKAQGLHRQYLYLRTIYESTCPRGRLKKHPFLFPAIPGADVPNSSQDIFCRDLLRGYSFNIQPSPDQDPHITSYETVYGIPYELLFLLTQVIELINKLHDSQSPSQGPSIPDHLVVQCDELENTIMEWRGDAIFEEAVHTNINSQIIHQQTIAFHNALIIYFAQHVRLLSHRFLQPYVKSVLESIEAMERIKIETNILAAPLYWPAFVAASEAFDKGLQDRFRRWHEHMQVYGIEALRTGMDVVEEVWRAGPTSRNRTTSYWRAIVEQKGKVLMLS